MLDQRRHERGATDYEEGVSFLGFEGPNGAADVLSEQRRVLPREGVSAEPARFRDCHTPALDFQDYIEDLDRLRASGRVAGRGRLRTRIYMASVLHAHRTTQLRAGRAERLIDAVVATIGRVVVS